MLNPYENTAPLAVRQKIRAGEITGQTSGMCLGYAQANLAVLPKDLAYDFLLFTQRNPKPCPILEVSDVGDPCLHKIAKGRIFRNTASMKKALWWANTPTSQSFGATIWSPF